MPKFSSKHQKREQVFKFSGFDGGYDQDTEAQSLSLSQLSECMNMKYSLSKDSVVLNVRQGSTKISNTALSGAADVLACTYYVNASKYILATATKLYYLDGSSDPVEIGSDFLEGVPTFTEFNSVLLIHDSGITKYWDGTVSPVLNTNYGKLVRSYADEVLVAAASIDGTSTEFSGTLTNPAIKPSTLTITFTDTTTKTITDNGVGRLTGNVAGETSGVYESVDGAADNGAGLIRLTLTGHGFSDGDEVNVADVGGASLSTNTAANPTWTVVGKDTNTIDLTGSDSTGISYTSGGTVTTNAIIYSTGAYVFKTDGAPDCNTVFDADYDKVDGGAKSKAGLVRANRLYTWGDGDNTSRLTYSEVNDQKATDTSSGGGYLDIAPNNGQTLLGCLNFYTTLLCFKQYSLHRIDDFPDDPSFSSEPLTDDLGTIAHRTPLFEGGIISFMAKEGWVAMSASQRFGDIQKGVPLSANFKKNAVRYANATAYTAYNPIDNQLWLALSTDGGTTYLDYIYVQNLDTNGVVSLYQFEFSHTCFSSVNGEMLIGGADGNLYKLDNTNTVFTDNSVTYSDNAYFRGAYTDWGLPNNKKHNKRVHIRSTTSASSFTATLKLFRDGQKVAFRGVDVSTTPSYPYVYGSGIEVYDMKNMPIFSEVTEYDEREKFNYKKLMYELREISVSAKIDISGVEFTSAVIGD